MGFYGNITNTSRTTFQFDKVYSSRFDMDGHCSADGVYNGRYVLVEYDSALDETLYKLPYILIIEDNAPDILYYATDSGQINDWAPDEEYYHYFKGPDKENPLTTSLLGNLKLIYLLKGQRYEVYNPNEIQFVRFNTSKTYQIIDEQTFISRYPWNTYGLISAPTDLQEKDEDWFLDYDIHRVYIANDELYYNEAEDVNPLIFNYTDIDGYTYGVIFPYGHYDYNEEPEFWQINSNSQINYNEKVFPTLDPLPLSEDEFTQNFNLDKQYYGTSRGYDSTVWQKVFVSGIEKYVMIAELNTVVPTFGLTADPPSLIPLNPHWGADSTNVYYSLHWQPQWGFRVKAANRRLTVPSVGPNGELFDESRQYGYSYMRDQSADATMYPSDVDVVLSAEFQDHDEEYNPTNKVLYYDPWSEYWQPSYRTTPGAIYFNKDGFNPRTIAYSSDLLDVNIPSRYNRDYYESHWENKDIISITPTGLSGNVYNTHDGTYVKKMGVDTQEFSLMLPSIGDTFAQIWDIVYGGRGTSTYVDRFNERLTDISWENGGDHLYRLGLRLRNGDNEYNTAALETLAGCINTAHDLLGMIIKPYPNKAAIEVDIDNLNSDRIFYDENEKKYYRKYTDYEYTALDPGDFDLITVDHRLDALDSDKLNTGIYWLGATSNAEDTVYNPNTTYYYKSVKEKYEPAEFNNNTNQLVSFPYDGYEWYIDKDNNLHDYIYTRKNLNSSTYVSGKYFIKVNEDEYEIAIGDFITGQIYYERSEPEFDKYVNYIHSTSETYQKDKQYYKVTVGDPVNLQDYYLPKTYFYVNSRGNVALDNNEDPTPGREYYLIKTDQLTDNLTNRGFIGVYVPGKYYYRALNGDFILDTTPSGSLINSSDNYYMQEEDPRPPVVEGEEREQWYPQPICFTMAEAKTIVDEASGESVLYIEKTTYVALDGTGVGKEKLTEATYIKNLYYIENSEYPDNSPVEFIVSEEEFDPEVLYYAKHTTYEARPAGSQVTLEIEHQFNLNALAKYREQTYFIKLRNDLNDISRVTELEFVTYNNLSINQMLEGSQTIFVFGDYPNSSEVSDVTFEDANDGIPFMSFKDRAAYEQRPSNDQPPIIQRVTNFYYAGTFHYRDPITGSFILDRRPRMVGNQYYIIDSSKVEKLELENNNTIDYVEEGTWYYKREEDNAYILLTPENFNEYSNNLIGHVYKKQGIYVLSDNRENEDVLLAKGMEWNVKAKSIPNHITLATREPVSKIKEIPLYANSDSTLNGMILKMYQTLEPDDINIRDTNTVAGSINKMKDLIAGFNSLVSRQLVIVDDAGRIHSSAISTAQKDSCTLEKIPGSAYVNADKYPTITANNLASRNIKQWITVHIDGDLTAPRVSIHHNFQPVQDTTSAVNKNTDNVVSNAAADNINLYTPIVDEMGHVVGKNTETVTLPYGFKTIAINSAAGNLETDMETSTTSIVAENTQDTLTINSHDKWIKLATDATNDTLTIAHEIHSITTTALTKDFNDTNSGDTFVATDIAHDVAGHITANQNHTYTLPYGWKTISTNGSSNTVTDLTANTTNVIANNCKDTLTINTGNKWIKMAGDDTNNTFTIAHEVNTITETPIADTNLDGIGHFTVQDITKDAAGHITAIQSHKYTLPYSFRNITVGAASSAATGSTGLTTAATLEADAYNDTLIINPSNKWIAISNDISNDTITIGHAAPVSATTTKGDSSDQAPQFGGTFKALYAEIDELGHVYSLTDHSITIPTIGITTATDGNVVTSGSFANSGALTLSTSQLGGLSLAASYTKASTSQAIANTDSLNTALGKLEYKADTAIAEFSNYASLSELQDEVANLKTIITNLVTLIPDSVISASDKEAFIDSLGE